MNIYAAIAGALGDLLGGPEDYTFEFSHVKTIARQMLQALGCMHKKRLVHADVKPGNILYMEDESIRLCDFGVAMKLGDGAAQLDTTRGTYTYMSIELLTERKIDTVVRI